MEANLINMSGGLTGGDVIEWSVAASHSTRVATTTGSMKRYVSGLGDRFMVPCEVFAAQGEIEPGAGALAQTVEVGDPAHGKAHHLQFLEKIMGGF
jgi:hypothetical protein